MGTSAKVNCFFFFIKGLGVESVNEVEVRANMLSQNAIAYAVGVPKFRKERIKPPFRVLLSMFSVDRKQNLVVWSNVSILVCLSKLVQCDSGRQTRQCQKKK